MSAPVMDKPAVASRSSEQGGAKSSCAPFVAALLVIALGAFALVYFRAHQKLGAPGVKLVDVPLLDAKGNPKTTQSVPLPTQVLDFHSEPVPIDDTALSGLPYDTTYGFMYYSADDGFRSGAKVVLMGGDRTSIHKPEFCLPGNGWQIIKKDTDEIQILGSHPYKLPVMKWTVEQQGRGADGRPATVEGIYVFWFVNDREITREHSGRMISIAKSMLTKGELERWAYISYLAMYAPGQEDATYERLKRLIAASVPQFQLVNGASEAAK